MRGLIGPGLPALGDLGTALAPRLAPTDAELLHAAIEAALAQRTTLALELRLAGPVERYLHLTGRAQHDAGGQPVRMVGCAWDSTGEHAAARLLAAKEAAETASRAKSAFLSRMSHELRTPLNAILGFSQLMRMEAERGDLVLKPHRVDYIETAARHLLDLINEVLDVSRIEAGKMRVDDVELELPTLVSECLPLVQLQAEQAGVRLLNLIEPGGPLRAYGDRLRLKEVLINLLSNAVKYNRPGGSVGVSVQRRLDRIEIEVQDSGRGLSPEQRAQLFQPFNRVGAEATRIEGSGMGLFVSKRFVELMGGSLHVDSNPGVGSTFTVSLRPAR
jgi:signal transduction histidine kinase